MGHFPSKKHQFKKVGDKRVGNKETQRKGGLVKSHNKKLAAKIRWMKQHGVNERLMDQYQLLIEDPKMGATDYLHQVKMCEDLVDTLKEQLKDVKDKDGNPIKPHELTGKILSLQSMIANMKARAYDMMHKSNNTNIQINVNTITKNDREAKIGKILKTK